MLLAWDISDIIRLQTIVIDDPGCLSVCLSRGWAVQKWLKRSMSCLGWRVQTLGEARNIVLDDSPHPPEQGEGFSAAIDKLLWPLVLYIRDITSAVINRAYKSFYVHVFITKLT